MATQTGSIDLRGVKQSYESVDVGGRNLYLKTGSSDFFTTTGNNKNGSAVVLERTTDSEIGEFDVLKITLPANTATAGCYMYPNRNCTVNGQLETGEIYTFSFWAKCEGDMLPELLKTSVAEAQTIVSSSDFSPTTTWKQYWVTFVCNSNMQATCFYNSRTTAGYFYIAKFKLEKGNKVTDWTPAPEDVQDGIDTAQNTATSAQNTANTAQVAANDAQANANYAIDSANVATEFANAAQNTANEAMDNVSNIEQIVGASTWVTSHGVYNKSTDTEVDTTKEYFTVSATAISDPKGNPHNGLYYEFSNNTYVLTSDNVVVTGKTYYTLSANLVDSPSGNPSTNGYYERNLHESVEEYLSTHILMKSDGLFVTDGSDSQVQINPTGVSILNGEKTIASYGSVAQIGAADEFHIMIGGEENEIGFYQGENIKLAYLNGNELYVQNSLSFGNAPHNTFTFYQRANGHFTLKLVD